MDGDVASTPYIAITLTLVDPIQYQIYNQFSAPIMDLSWNNVVLSPWTLVNYEVEVSVNDGSFNQVATTTNINYYYNVSVNGNICDEELKFRITAHLSQTVGGVTTTYDIQSNTASKNVFEYSLAPASGYVNWAVRDPSESTMSVDITFTNPTSVGCGEPVNFVVNVYNAPTGGSIIHTLEQPYDLSANEYNINMDEITYASNGRVEVYLITTDTNGGLNNNGAIATYSFTTNEVPIYRNVVLTPSSLSFKIISATLLAPVAGLLYLNQSTSAMEYIPWLTTGGTPGITVSSIEDGEHIYSVTIFPLIFSNGSFPVAFGIVSANSAGIGEISLFNF
jgi:hypothetical protein